MSFYRPPKNKYLIGLFILLAGGTGGVLLQNKPPKPPIEAEAPPVIVEPPPVAEAPAPAPPETPEWAAEWTVVAGHFDGVDKMSSSTLRSWMTAADAHVAEMAAAGIPDTWELTAGEVKKLEAARPGWLRTVQDRGVTLVGREPHLNDPGGDAYAAQEQLLKAGARASTFLGSCMQPLNYVSGPWMIFGTGAVPGHTTDTSLSGFEEIAVGRYALYTGTADSVALKRKVAGMVKSGELAAAFEIIRYNGADPRTGAQPWFASPARHDGTQAPVPILEDIQRVVGEVASDGNSDKLRFTVYETALDNWLAAGKPSAYVVPRTPDR